MRPTLWEMESRNLDPTGGQAGSQAAAGDAEKAAGGLLAHSAGAEPRGFPPGFSPGDVDSMASTFSSNPRSLGIFYSSSMAESQEILSAGIRDPRTSGGH